MKMLQRITWCFLLITFLQSPKAFAEKSITPRSLELTEAKIQSLVSKAMPATVSLIPAGPTRVYGTGSGVIINPEGLILTAAHVIMDMGDRVTVIFPNGDRATARVLGMDFGRDSGMLQIVGRDKKYPYVPLGNSNALTYNDWCIALGHAGGYQHDRTPPVRLGRIISTDPENFITSDSVLIGGDSGGPLFDLEGRLIGIHSNIGYQLSQNNHVPINTFKDNWDRLLMGRKFGEGLLRNRDKAMIGAQLSNTDEGTGVLIQEIVPNSPAARSKLRRGDVILKFGTKPLTNVSAFIEEIVQYGAGETIKLTIRAADSNETRVIPVVLESASNLGYANEDKDADPRLKQQQQRSLKNISPEKLSKLKVEFDQLMRRSIDEGRLLLTPNDIQKFGGPAQMGKFMEEFSKTVKDKRKLDKLFEAAEPPPPVRPKTYDPDKPLNVEERFFRMVLNAFRPSVDDASESTHLVFRGNTWKSLCTVVHEDGYVVTKASEIMGKDRDKALTVLLAKGKLRSARIIKQYSDYDLALLKIDRSPKLIPVTWYKPNGKLPLGMFVSAAGSSPDPVAIGVVSVQARSMSGKNKGYLGIRMGNHERGVRVIQVMPDGNAGAAGVRVGDIITGVNDEACDTPEKLIQEISGTKPGESVSVSILRGTSAMRLKVTLRDREALDAAQTTNQRHNKMNKFGTEVSKRSSGYLNAIQTDLPIQPQECGGPVVDLDGNVIGINISRAGRIKTYALPTYEVRKLIEPDLPRG